MVLVCNQNLFEKAKILGVTDFIQTQGFSRRTWYPDMKLLHGKKTGEQLAKHRLGDKSVGMMFLYWGFFFMLELTEFAQRMFARP